MQKLIVSNDNMTVVRLLLTISVSLLIIGVSLYIANRRFHNQMKRS